jgi:hypothetical protein
MILEFTIDGDSSSNGAQTFTLPHSYTFRTLRLKHVIYSISNDSLSETWPKSTAGITAPDRTVYAPLYLDVNGVPGIPAYSQYNFASSASTYDMSNVIAFGHAAAPGGSSEQPNKISTLDMKLIDDEETVWDKDSTVTLAVKQASVESAGSFGLPAAFTSTTWDDSCRISVVLELDDMLRWDDGAGNTRDWVF